jgi:4-phospho-D-threonate 3-dehydrogenase / 4-phospho-D-erythronate 3-dehydrogenase
MHKPIIAISMGDPAGIGPEICLKALSLESTYTICKPLIVGCLSVLEHTRKILGFDLEFHVVDDNLKSQFSFGTVDVVDIDNVSMDQFEFNKVSAMCGNASFEYVLKVIEMASNKLVDATVTGPIHKEALKAAGHDFAGHTEIFAHYTHTKNYSMMLAEGDFRVVHVSTHVSLLEAIARVKKDRILM